MAGIGCRGKEGSMTGAILAVAAAGLIGLEGVLWKALKRSEERERLEARKAERRARTAMMVASGETAIRCTMPKARTVRPSARRWGR